MRLSHLVALALLGVLLFGVAAQADPIVVNVEPVAVYYDAFRPFGMAYDSSGDTIYYTQGDDGDELVHSARAFASFSAAELAAFTQVGGVYQLTTTEWEKDSAGAGSFATGGGSAKWGGMAYDESTGQLVMQPYSGGAGLDSFDVGGGNYNGDYGDSPSGFLDGLDVDSGNIYASPDVQDIYENNVLLVDKGPAALPTWNGVGGTNTFGWSGVERIGDLLYAVAVQSGGDTGRTRTIAAYDLSGNLVSYDDDGDPVAARWEDMAFDGRYLYAADLRGNADGDAVIGDIYVFDIIGDGGSVLDPVPEPGSMALIGFGIASVIGSRVRRRRRRSV